MRTQHAYYEIHGEGTPVLILHGWGGSSQTWQKFMQEKPRTFQWVIVDLPGFGQSNDPQHPYTVSDYTNWIKQVYQELPVKPQFLLTHSFGGRIAAKWLSSENHPFKKAILAAAAGLKSKPTLKQQIGQILSKLKALTPNSVQKPLQKLLYKVLRVHDFPSSPVMQETFKKVVAEDLSEDFSQINIPITLVWGENDTYTPLEQGQKLEQIIPNAKLVTFEKIGHGIHRQAEEKLATICTQFFKEAN